jgi:hypothetical protein
VRDRRRVSRARLRESEGFPGYVTVAIGNFADPNFPAPNIAVWEESRHPWAAFTAPHAAQRRGEAGVTEVCRTAYDPSSGRRGGAQVQILPLRPNTIKDLAIVSLALDR